MTFKLIFTLIFALAPLLSAETTSDLLMGSVVKSDKWTMDRANDLEIFDGAVSLRNAAYNLKADHAVYDRRMRTWAIRGSVYCLRKFLDGSNIELYCDNGTYRENFEQAELFRGRELTVGILGGLALPLGEIVPHEGFYDYEHKYTRGASDYHVPAALTDDQTRAVQAVALAAHASLGLEVYSRVDVLLDASGSPSVLEVNTIPGMTETSLLPKAAAVAGLEFSMLCEEIAGLSLSKTCR